jgi:hypothetical protein
MNKSLKKEETKLTEKFISMQPLVGEFDSKTTTETK